MKLIVITSPDFIPEEARIITGLFEVGLDLLHLRKPDATAHEVGNLLHGIPMEYRKQIVIHDFFPLKDEFSLGGIHLNSRHSEAPEGYQGLLSRACHSLEEVKTMASHFDYVLMSPVYDSISKQGYRSGYSQEALRQAQAERIINEKVVALGGISAANLSEIKALGFGGAALLGDIWNRYQTWEDAKEVLATIHKWQKKLYEQWGLHFIHAGDEWYLLAGEPIPEEENYDGYIQLENGVGMLRLLEDEVAEELSKREGDDRHRHVTIATGKAAAPSLKKHMQKIREKYPNVQAEVVTIINYFFGESITVSGLITGKDLMEQLEGRDLGDCLLLPCNMLRSGKNVFLDDVTVEEVEERLKTPVQIIDEPGSDLVKAVVEENQETIHRRRTMYEQADCSNCGPAERG